MGVVVGEAALPWNAFDYPASMRHLSERVRLKAVEIANALLAEGMDEGKAIRIAIAKAKEWAAHQGWPVRDNDGGWPPSGPLSGPYQGPP